MLQGPAYPRVRATLCLRQNLYGAYQMSVFFTLFAVALVLGIGMYADKHRRS